MNNRYPTLCTVLVVLVLLTGCLGQEATNTGGNGTTPQTSDGSQEDFALKELPAEPATLTNESALNYAQEYETTHRWNQVVKEYRNRSEKLTNLDISVTNVSVTRKTDAKYFVHIEYAVGITEVDGKKSAKDMKFTANYRITNSTTHRAVTTGYRTPGPNVQANGTTIN